VGFLVVFLQNERICDKTLYYTLLNLVLIFSKAKWKFFFNFRSKDVYTSITPCYDDGTKQFTNELLAQL
jgi:hypothetical protein